MPSRLPRQDSGVRWSPVAAGKRGHLVIMLPRQDSEDLGNPVAAEKRPVSSNNQPRQDQMTPQNPVAAKVILACPSQPTLSPDCALSTAEKGICLESLSHPRMLILGRCPTRAVGESTTYGSKPRRYGQLSHKAAQRPSLAPDGAKRSGAPKPKAIISGVRDGGDGYGRGLVRLARRRFFSDHRREGFREPSSH